MKKSIATLIAVSFASAAFAHSPAPASAATPATVKVETSHEKQDVKAETRAGNARADVKHPRADAVEAKAKARVAKKSASHARHKSRHLARTASARHARGTVAAPATRVG